LALEPIKPEAGAVPNVIGMGVRDAVYLLEKKGLTVEIKGVGRVKKQSIPPGTPSRKYKTIQIELS
jgi:cell division protein FtsI (penicillin-binding protein 3)